MLIEDECLCGAVFSVTGSFADCAAIHDRWITAHRVCRNQAAHDAASAASEDQHSEPGRVDDTARLDKLERLGDPGVPWIARQSSRGRGYRLHQSWSHAAVQPTVREAIDAAPEPEGEGG